MYFVYFRKIDQESTILTYEKTILKTKIITWNSLSKITFWKVIPPNNIFAYKECSIRINGIPDNNISTMAC